MKGPLSHAPTSSRIFITVLAIVFVVETIVMVALPVLLPTAADERVAAVADVSKASSSQASPESFTGNPPAPPLVVDWETSTQFRLWPSFEVGVQNEMPN